MTEFKDRLNIALKSQSVNGAAKKCGISQGLMRKYLSGSIPSVEKVAQLANALGVSFLWLALGEGTPEGQSAALAPAPAGMVNVPVMSVVASAGHGAAVLKEEVSEHMTLSATLVRSLRLTPGETFIIYARGESMEPVIHGGEPLICSKAERHIKAMDGIYAVRLEGDVLVKHIQRLPGGKVRIFSENSRYHSFEVTLNDGVDFAILGKVLHAIRQV